MSHIAIYRQFRPTTFDEVIGQPNIITALQNQVASGNISHAYLFCGARGTGKTSCAKIFARAINCENNKNGSPCGKCPTCKALESENTDIIEIDAASNNGVDEIRQLKEKVQFVPTIGKYKVYIIDEVHMLTDNAANALLKTLEEPPKHVVFILATTESYRLLPTILSRCMRFDFSLVSQDVLENHLKKIFDLLKIKSDAESIELIAKCADGGVRDLLSLADMCNSYCMGNLTFDKVLPLLGITSREKLFVLARSVLQNDIQNLFENLEEILKSDNANIVNKNLISYFLDICIAKTSKDPQKLLKYSKEDFEKLNSLAKICETKNLIRIIEILSGIEYEIKNSLQPKIILQSTLLKCCDLQFDNSLNAILLRLQKLESNQNEPKIVARKTSKVAIDDKLEVVEQAKNKAEFEPKIEPAKEYSMPQEELIPPVSQPSFESGHDSIANSYSMEKLWGLFIAELKSQGYTMLYTICVEQACKLEQNLLTILCRSEQILQLFTSPANFAKMETALKKLGDYTLQLQVAKSTDIDTTQMEKLQNMLGNKLKKL